ncbi:MAG TPA: hypothetical protein VF669_08105 [Tepidisphaeraceae bacterium]
MSARSGLIRQRILPIVAGILLSIPMGAAAFGPAEVDQEYLAAPINNSIVTYAVSANQSWGETFTCARGGVLTQVDLQISRSVNTTQPLQVALRKVISGKPDLSAGGLLYMAVIDASAIPAAPGNVASGFTATISLLNNEIPVASGEQVAIVASSAAPSPDWYTWSSQNLDLYGGGTALWKPASSSSFSIMSDRDSGFRTWVALPEPASVALLSFAALAMLGRRIRRL